MRGDWVQPASSGYRNLQGSTATVDPGAAPLIGAGGDDSTVRGTEYGSW